jgi:hypothetical protein
MNYKSILIAIAVITLVLNLFLTIYMLKALKRTKDNRDNQTKRVVTFQLPQDNKSGILSTVVLDEKDETLQL